MKETLEVVTVRNENLEDHLQAWQAYVDEVRAAGRVPSNSILEACFGLEATSASGEDVRGIISSRGLEGFINVDWGGQSIESIASAPWNVEEGRQGIGSSLLRDVFRTALEKGISDLNVISASPSYGFYKKVGFINGYGDCYYMTPCKMRIFLARESKGV